MTAPFPKLNPAIEPLALDGALACASGGGVLTMDEAEPREFGLGVTEPREVAIGAALCDSETLRQSVADGIAEDRKELDRRHAEDRATGRIRLTDLQLSILATVVEDDPLPAHAYGLYKRLAPLKDAAASEQAIRNTLDRLDVLGLVTKDEHLFVGTEGPARNQYRVTSLENALEVIAAEHRRREAFVARLRGLQSKVMEARFAGRNGP